MSKNFSTLGAVKLGMVSSLSDLIIYLLVVCLK